MTPLGCRVTRTSCPIMCISTETRKKVTNHRGQSQNKQSGFERTCPTCVCCIVQCWSWLVVVVVVECCCCILYQLALMLVLTFAPCTLTFAPCTSGVSLLSTSASTPLAHIVVVTGCNLRWWRFSFSH